MRRQVPGQARRRQGARRLGARRLGARRAVTVAAVALLALLSLGLAACGVPPSDGARPVESDITGLLDRGDPSASPGATAQSEAVVVWVRGERLVAATRLVVAQTAQERLDAVLAVLLAGPSSDEREQGLTTLLPPDLRIDGVVDGHHAVLALTAGSALEPGRVSLAVGQAALTALAVPGVKRVTFVVDGEAARVPLPDGGSARVVRGSDFAPVTRTS